MAPKSGGVAHVSRTGDVSVVEFCGHITAAIVEDAVAQLGAHLSEASAAYLLIDGTAIEGYSADVRGPGVALLKVAKRNGVVAGACVSPSSAVRMMGAAVAFVASLPFDFVETRRQAEHAISQRRTRHADAG